MTCFLLSVISLWSQITDAEIQTKWHAPVNLICCENWISVYCSGHLMTAKVLFCILCKDSTYPSKQEVYRIVSDYLLCDSSKLWRFCLLNWNSWQTPATSEDKRLKKKDKILFIYHKNTIHSLHRSERKEIFGLAVFKEDILFSFSGLWFWFWTCIKQLNTTDWTVKSVDLHCELWLHPLSSFYFLHSL